MYDDGNEILEMRSHIDRLTPFIEEQSKKITDDSSFAERFAFVMNQSALASKKAHLKELAKNNIKEFIEVHLTGENVGVGTAPLESVTGFLGNFQNFFYRTAQSIQYGNSSSNAVPKGIKISTELQIEALRAGSMKILLSGKSPEISLFDCEEYENYDSLFADTVSKVFDVLSQPTADRAIEKIACLGVHSFKAYKDLVSSIVDNRLNVDGLWYPICGETRKYECQTEVLRGFIPVLEKVRHETDFVTLVGTFTAINSETKRFRYKTESGKSISGTFSEKTKSKLKKMRVSPLDDISYEAEFTKNSVIVDATGQVKKSWALLNAVPLQTQDDK